MKRVTDIMAFLRIIGLMAISLFVTPTRIYTKEKCIMTRNRGKANLQQATVAMKANLITIGSMD
jgi:hypothetical protein